MMYHFMKPGCIYETVVLVNLPVAVLNPLFKWAEGDAVNPWELVYAQQYPQGNGLAHLKFIFEQNLCPW